MKKIFQNNILLKNDGVTEEFTPFHVEELTKCMLDPMYFIKNYVYIINLNVGLTKFDLYEYQQDLIQTALDNRFSIFVTARQMGKTTTIAAFLLYKAMFTKDYKIGVLANKKANAREILSRIQLMYENLPFWLKIGLKTWNKSTIHFSNGSKIFAAATTSSSIRGESVNCILLDEFAFVKNADEFYTSTHPVVSSGKDTKIIITSTPNGMNLFYKLYIDSKHNRNNFANRMYKWDAHPERDAAWLEEMRKTMSEQQFDQEFNCVTGDTKIVVRNKHTNEILIKTIQELYNEL